MSDTQEKLLAVFTPDTWLAQDAIALASGIRRPIVKYHLRQLVAAKKVIASGSTKNRKYALHGTPLPNAPKKTKAPATRVGKKRANKTAAASRAKPKQPEPRVNVVDFTPAMTADKRMVIVGGSEPLIFSTAQTQSIADLIFDNFEANA